MKHYVMSSFWIALTAAAFAQEQPSPRLAAPTYDDKPKAQGRGVFAAAQPGQPRYQERLQKMVKVGQTVPADSLTFQDADLFAVLGTYQKLSGRTIIRSSSLPEVKLSLEPETSLNRADALKALESLLAQNGIALIPFGTNFVKAVVATKAAQEAVPITELTAAELPESDTYVVFLYEAKHARPRDMAPALQPLSKLPNSIVAVDQSGILLLRDYSSNVKAMLQMLERIDKPGKKPLQAEKDEQKPPPELKQNL